MYYKYILIDNINNNFHKLFKNCKDGCEYIPLNFTLSENYTTFIILNQLIELLYKHSIKYQDNIDIDDIIIYELIDKLVISKCQEFVNTRDYKNFDNFKNSFSNYILGILTSYNQIYKKLNDFMEF